ncbi:MAG: hypothetical protein QM654_16805 [Dysgonamonadaceae bacterium]
MKPHAKPNTQLLSHTLLIRTSIAFRIWGICPKEAIEELRSSFENTIRYPENETASTANEAEGCNKGLNQQQG